MAVEASFSPCCPEPIAEGCTTTGTRWVSIRNPNGTISLIDPTDGTVVPPANVLDFCPAGQSQTHIQTVAASSVFVIPNAADLESWAVRARGTTVSIDVNGGGANLLDDNEVIQSSAQDDDIQSDTVTITTGVGSTARVIWIERL
jgi:hypothetical protein